jgi:two-component system, NarL family, sensor kinase
MIRSRLLVAVTWTAVAMAGLLAVATVAVALGYRHEPLDLTLAAITVVFLSVPIVGGAVARAEPRNAVGWILLTSGTALPLVVGAYLYSQAAFAPGSRLPGARLAGWLDGWPWVFAVALVPTFGLLLFPDGRLPSRRWRPVLWACAVLVGTQLVSVLFSPGLLDYPDQDNPSGLPGAAGTIAHGLGATIILVAPLATVTALSVHLRRRKAEDPAHAAALALVRPAAWLIAASWWSCIAISVTSDDSINALPYEAVAMVSLAVTAWIAIQRYGLFDTRLVISATLVYGTLTACVIGLYLAVAAGWERFASDTVSHPVAVAVAVLVALPLRDLLQRVANKLVYGYRDRPYEALVRLGHRLEDAAASEEVLPAVARTVREVLRVPHVAIEIDEEVLASAGRSAGTTPEEFPLVFAGETIGTLITEPREAGRPFTTAERRLLAGIARQVAAAGHAVSVTADLLRSRERLIAATEEERRRLRRDLHDGLGPGLAGLVLGLQRARTRLATDPAAATRQLDELTDQTQQAVAEVRRLVYGLRPPALDELGLVGALHEHARVLGGITVDGPDEAPPLPAAVEVAAYRIALEAMTNSARHARAATCTVRVDIDGALRLEIADDGTGLPEEYRAGVGISSMRERAAELGGTCTIERRTPTGTLVRATIPLEPA